MISINYNEKENSVLAGLGIGPEEFSKLSASITGLTIKEAMGKVLKDPELTPEQVIGLVFEMGAKAGEQHCIQRIQDAQVMEDLARNAKTQH